MIRKKYEPEDQLANLQKVSKDQKRPNPEKGEEGPMSTAG